MLTDAHQLLILTNKKVPILRVRSLGTWVISKSYFHNFYIRITWSCSFDWRHSSVAQHLSQLSLFVWCEWGSQEGGRGGSLLRRCCRHDAFRQATGRCGLMAASAVRQPAIQRYKLSDNHRSCMLKA